MQNVQPTKCNARLSQPMPVQHDHGAEPHQKAPEARELNFYSVRSLRYFICSFLLPMSPMRTTTRYIYIYIYMYRVYTNAFLSNNYLVRMLCWGSIGNPGDKNRFVRKSHETNTNPHLKTPVAGT